MKVNRSHRKFSNEKQLKILIFINSQQNGGMYRMLPHLQVTYKLIQKTVSEGDLSSVVA